MLRSLGAVAAGYFVFAASAALLFQVSGQEPHEPAPASFMIASILWGAAFALVGGWLAAHVSARRPGAHAAGVAALIALGALASLVARAGAAWSPVAALVVMAPCAWLGGMIAARRAA